MISTMWWHWGLVGWRHLQFFSNGRCFRRLVRGHAAIVGSRRPKIGAVTAEPASVLTYKEMTRARIAARSAEQIEPTDALLAGKVQRKVSNGIAGLAGSSRHRQKTRRFLPAQASCRDPGTRPELRSHRRSSNANSLCSRNAAGSPEICATFQRDILPRHF
jgi:hypothetical protein